MYKDITRSCLKAMRSRLQKDIYNLTLTLNISTSISYKNYNTLITTGYTISNKVGIYLLR
ncbi:uncharacterized protein N7518_002793 [Penicillium psychrosexuale]|uniref:uncharacterized protein n=1 Tax=Penicillium psychrosexuale TaxID=1002107 RepID=UPI0025458EF9|nr:uncharacterized protein N7518_002793 [Penicillium psychrosexuale]KAJ5800725.1 hypothetical protein N7518_002793 [Penicillium psychrosexuale]